MVVLPAPLGPSSAEDLAGLDREADAAHAPRARRSACAGRARGSPARSRVTVRARGPAATRPAGAWRARLPPDRPLEFRGRPLAASGISCCSARAFGAPAHRSTHPMPTIAPTHPNVTFAACRAAAATPTMRADADARLVRRPRTERKRADEEDRASAGRWDRPRDRADGTSSCSSPWLPDQGSSQAERTDRSRMR